MENKMFCFQCEQTLGFAIFAGTAVNDTSFVTAEGLYGVEGILSAAVTVKLVLAFYSTCKAVVVLCTGMVIGNVLIVIAKSIVGTSTPILRLK